MSGIYRESYLISRFCQAKLIRTSPKITNNHVYGNAKMGKLQSIVCSKRITKLNVTAINLE